MEKPTLRFIRKSFEKEKYKLLTIKYINNRQKLEYICPEGHRHSIAWNYWQEGHKCPYCRDIENSKRFRLDINIIEDSFKKSKYILLMPLEIYTNAHQQLNYICINGHKHSMTWNNWSKGYRCPTCFKENNHGENHPMWKGGISCEPYCELWVKKEFKNMIKERDNYQCQNPDCWGKNGGAGKLCVHHIDYDKKNCDPENLITLCVSCNARANTNRDDWEIFYKGIIMRRYKCLK